MATLEDKLLDGPRVHYCEADDDDKRPENDENTGDDVENHNHVAKGDIDKLFVRPDEETERLERLNRISWQGKSENTGPKGVIRDCQKRSRQSRQISDNHPNDDLDAEFQALLNDDSILREYASKRISEAARASNPNFGRVFKLNAGFQLLDAIDKEDKNVKVIVHLYVKFSKSCERLNTCLECLAKDYSHIKFVTLDASVAGLSDHFKSKGVPAILLYKSGNLIKSLIQLGEHLDDDFDTDQVRDLLIDQDILT